MKRPRPRPRALRFILFRVKPSRGRIAKCAFFGDDGHWTPIRSRARTGTLAAMKALMGKLKKEYPDVILEEVRD